MHSELLNGRNPKADARLAADLGVRLTEDFDGPPVAIGPAGYEVDEKGEPVEMPAAPLLGELRGEHEKTLLSIGFVRGIGAMREVLRKNGVELPIDALMAVMDLTLKSRELSQKKL